MRKAREQQDRMDSGEQRKSSVRVGFDCIHSVPVNFRRVIHREREGLVKEKAGTQGGRGMAQSVKCFVDLHSISSVQVTLVPEEVRGSLGISGQPA